MAAFASLGVDDAVCRALSEALPGITDPTDVQRSAIPLVGRLLDGSAAKTQPQEDAHGLAEVVGRDTAVLRAQTGSGKTLAFLLPIVSRMLVDARTGSPGDRPGAPSAATKRESIGTLAVVVVPTRELAAQTERMLSAIFSRLRGRDHWPVSCALVGTSHRGGGGEDEGSHLAAAKQRKHEKERLRRGVHVVVGTPGRLLDHIERTEGWARRAALSVRCVVLDEADRLLDSGFRKTVSQILSTFTSPSLVRVLCSATLSPSSVLSLLSGGGDSVRAVAPPSRDTPESALARTGEMHTPGTLTQEYIVPPTRARLAALVGLAADIAEKTPGARIVVFGICCDVVDALYAALRLCTRPGTGGGAYDPFARLLPRDTVFVRLHGGMPQAERAQAMARYTSVPERKTEDKDAAPAILVATDVAARGLNLSAVDAILQYDAPCDLADYVHRAGRSARAGAEGRSVLFLMPSERAYAGRLAEALSAGSGGASRLQRLRWEPFVERVAMAVPESVVSSSAPTPLVPAKSATAAAKETAAKEATVEEADGLEDAPLTVRRRLHAWQAAVEAHALKTSLDASLHAVAAQKRALKDSADTQPLITLGSLGEKAFLAFVRAYATHPAAEKDIFHIRRLHLGHLAASFCLGEPPRRVANRFRSAGSDSATYSRGRRVVLDKRVADELGLRTDGTKKRR